MGNRRSWEIDFLRAIAIILMVIFHIVFDLNEFIGINIDYTRGFWYWKGKASALMFIFLAVISSGFSKNTVKRGITVVAFAMTITLFSYIFLENSIFGSVYYIFWESA